MGWLQNGRIKNILSNGRGIFLNSKKHAISKLTSKLHSCIDIKNSEPAYYTNRAIAYLKLSQFANARNDCKAALRIDEKFSKAYNRLSKCNIALGELAEASINL